MPFMALFPEFCTLAPRAANAEGSTSSSCQVRAPPLALIPPLIYEFQVPQTVELNGVHLNGQKVAGCLFLV